uniref:Uncharacterized protein n=1 Tax=Rhizophora mucronata TaxID=61149 RepID=A0A2P2PQR9_RHIMU
MCIQTVYKRLKENARKCTTIVVSKHRLDIQ